MPAACRARNGTHKQCYHWILSHGTHFHLLAIGGGGMGRGCVVRHSNTFLQFSRASSFFKCIWCCGRLSRKWSKPYLESVWRCICNGCWHTHIHSSDFVSACLERRLISRSVFCQCRPNLLLLFWLPRHPPRPVCLSSLPALIRLLVAVVTRQFDNFSFLIAECCYLLKWHSQR